MRGTGFEKDELLLDGDVPNKTDAQKARLLLIEEQTVYLALMLMVLGLTDSTFGRVTVRIPFWKSALALSV